MEAIKGLRAQFGGSSLFGNEKDDSFKSSIGTIYQSFSGVEFYPSIEEKAAQLLYFVVKNHSFTDGNKRIAAWLFGSWRGMKFYTGRMAQKGSRITHWWL